MIYKIICFLFRHDPEIEKWYFDTKTRKGKIIKRNVRIYCKRCKSYVILG